MHQLGCSFLMALWEGEVEEIWRKGKGESVQGLVWVQSTKGKFLHCVHTAHAEAGILTQVIRLVVTILFPLGIHFRKMNNPKIFDYGSTMTL